MSPSQAPIIPPFIKPGDTVAITAPARAASLEEIRSAVQWLEQNGFKVRLGKTIGTRWHQFSAKDPERAQDLQELVLDPEVRAIFCARGGYGCTRILDRINWVALKSDPKWLVGFSDITAIHQHLLTQKISSLHAEMPVRFRHQEQEIKSWDNLLHAITGKSTNQNWPATARTKDLDLEAPLLGGNLSVLYSLLGSESLANTQGHILFLEDLDEYLYHVDRMVLALKRAGYFTGIKALLIGGMTEMRDNTVPFGMTPEQIILEHLGQEGFPILFGLPVGHTALNLPLVQGGNYELKVRSGKVQLQWRP